MKRRIAPSVWPARSSATQSPQAVPRSNPADALKDALAPVSVTHHAALTNPRDIGDLLLDIDG